MKTSEPKTPQSIPIIFNGGIHKTIPQGFNSLCIELDGQLASDLNWMKQEKYAQSVSDQGFHLLWHIHLGLFKNLPLPLSDISQYKSLHLALDHFLKLF